MGNKDDLACLLDIDVNERSEYKLHAAVKNKAGSEPLDAYIEDRAGVGKVGDRWRGWQEHQNYPKEGDKFRRRWPHGRDYILSFMRVYPEGKDTWLFGGIFKVIERPKEKGEYYKVELTDKGRKWIGRLKITYHNSSQQPYLLLETDYEKLELIEILKTPYSAIP